MNIFLMHFFRGSEDLMIRANLCGGIILLGYEWELFRGGDLVD